MFNELIDASNTSLKEGLFTALPVVDTVTFCNEL